MKLLAAYLLGLIVALVVAAMTIILTDNIVWGVIAAGVVALVSGAAAARDGLL